jgi:hypothetical protein
MGRANEAEHKTQKHRHASPERCPTILPMNEKCCRSNQALERAVSQRSPQCKERNPR